MNHYDYPPKIFSKLIYVQVVIIPIIIIIIPHILADSNFHVFSSFTAKNQVFSLTKPLEHLPVPKTVKS